MTDTPALHAGWYLVAFVDELTGPLTPVTIGNRRLMLVRTEQATTLYDSICPHRGADLAYGGTLRGKSVLCPFHGRKITLGEARHPYAVRGYQTVTLGTMVLARLGTGADGDCHAEETLRTLIEDRDVHPAVTTRANVPVDYVVENAFDAEHFSVVHGVPAVQGMQASRHADGYLTIGGTFLTVQDPWVDESLRDYLRATLGPGAREQARKGSGFSASAFSPTLVATVFGSGDEAAVIVTGALPTPGGTQVRVAVATRPGPHVERVVKGARTAIDQDLEVWDHLDPTAPCHLDELDEPVIAFQEFCRSFAALDDGADDVPASGSTDTQLSCPAV